jgi:hypothetical protein
VLFFAHRRLQHHQHIDDETVTANA